MESKEYCFWLYPNIMDWTYSVKGCDLTQNLIYPNNPYKTCPKCKKKIFEIRVNEGKFYSVPKSKKVDKNKIPENLIKFMKGKQ